MRVIRRVYVESWQIQCCGDEFALRSKVEWTVVADPDLEFLSAVLGSHEADAITDIEEHHGLMQLRDEPLIGTVHGITAVFCSYAAPSTGKALYPVSGTAVLEPRERADGWEQEDAHTRVFVGYLVDVDDESKRT